METNAYKEPVYLISAVSEILNIHPQTLRQYEREGLINPSRSNGKIRLYSQADIDHIRYVLSLTRDLGINLSGVDFILHLNKKIKTLEDEVELFKNKFREYDKFSVVPSSKALVIKQCTFDIVTIKED